MSTDAPSFYERLVDVTVRPVSDIERELSALNLSENRRKLLGLELQAAREGIDSFRTIERLEAVTLSPEDYARNAQAHLEKLQAIHEMSDSPGHRAVLREEMAKQVDLMAANDPRMRKRMRTFDIVFWLTVSGALLVVYMLKR